MHSEAGIEVVRGYIWVGILVHGKALEITQHWIVSLGGGKYCCLGATDTVLWNCSIDGWNECSSVMLLGQLLFLLLLKGVLVVLVVLIL